MSPYVCWSCHLIPNVWLIKFPYLCCLPAFSHRLFPGLLGAIWWQQATAFALRLGNWVAATGVSWISARITLELYEIDILHTFGRRSPQVSTTCLRDLKSAFSIFWFSSIFWAQNFWLLFAFHHMSVQTLQNILTVSQSEIGSNHSLHCHNKMQKLGGTARGQRHKCTP